MSTKTRSILLNVPGIAFTCEALMPEARLAAFAGALVEGGHDAQVWDLGNLETLASLCPPQWSHLVRQWAAHAIQGESYPVEPRGFAPARRKRYAQIQAGIVEDLAKLTGLDFVVLSISTPDLLPGALELAERIRRRLPGVKLTAAGAWLDGYAPLLLEWNVLTSFDAVFIGDNGQAIREWAERLAWPEVWVLIPNVLPVRVDGARQVSLARRVLSGAVAQPEYGPEVYPALHTTSKLPIYTVRESLGCGEGCHACAEPGLNGGEAHVYGAGVLCDEFERLGAKYGARAFRLIGPGAPSQHAKILAQAIMARRLSMAYTRNLQMCDADPMAALLLRDSGCEVCTARVETGSQRLAEDYYGRDTRVSQMEPVLRALVAEEIYTLARFTYPCPADDYHTTAETYRILNRTRPHAVDVRFPEIMPGSDWRQWAADFGFEVCDTRQRRWVLRGCPPLRDVSPREWPYTMTNHAPRRAIFEYEELIGQLAEWNMAAYMTPEMALWARAAGRVGAEAAFGREVLALLHWGDAEGLAESLAPIRQKPLATRDIAGYRAFVPVRAAVGN